MTLCRIKNTEHLSNGFVNCDEHLVQTDSEALQVDLWPLGQPLYHLPPPPQSPGSCLWWF